MKQTSPPLRWTAPEFDSSSTRAPLLLILVFLGMVVYALIENSPIMAITFVLLGTVTFLHSRKPPRTLNCALTKDGLTVGQELYPLDNIASFWIIYEPGEQSLFLKTKGSLIASVRVPLGNMSPNTLREALIGNIREEKYEPTILDTLSRFLHI
jgi:hypothetical protein